MIPNLTIRTKEERDALLALLSEVSQKVFSSSELDFAKTMSVYESYSWFADIKLFLDDLKKRILEPRLYAQEIKELSEYLFGLEVVKMSLSFTPSVAFVKESYDILSPLSAGQIIVDFTLDESISSGAKLFFKGNYIDLSLQARIASLLKTEDVINKYL